VASEELLGRNSLALARAGIAVHALEPAPEAARALSERADAEGVPVRVWAEPFAGFAGDPAGHGAVLLFGLIQLLSRPKPTSSSAAPSPGRARGASSSPPPSPPPTRATRGSRRAGAPTATSAT
jgi:hypothetical protein